jgi:hypothetical protein
VQQARGLAAELNQFALIFKKAGACSGLFLCKPVKPKQKSAFRTPQVSHKLEKQSSSGAHHKKNQKNSHLFTPFATVKNQPDNK